MFPIMDRITEILSKLNREHLTLTELIELESLTRQAHRQIQQAIDEEVGEINNGNL